MEMTERDQAEWPERPWIMAAIGAVAGFLFWTLVDGLRYDKPITADHLLQQSAAAALAVSSLSFLITAERQRWPWAVAFSIVWGAIIGLVGYSAGSYSRTGELMGMPFMAGLLAVGIAGPLFQSMRDEGRRALPYDKVHFYAWTDAIIGAASFAFTGLSFLIAFLLAALFDAIGITALKDLLKEGGFCWAMAGAAWGAASAILRERDSLLGTLQRLVMLVFSLIAPVLAFALAVYLVALPVTGFGGLWKSGLPETPLLLTAAGACFVFLNAIIGDSHDDRNRGKLWRATEIVLLVAVLPLGLLALVSMGMRVGQYGWTPERLWGVIASLVAVAFGLANWWALFRGRATFDERVRTHQKQLAVGLCGLALFLALPIVDFGAISTKSQLARLAAGKVAVSEFDWKAMAFDFGPSGRKALEDIRARGPDDQRLLAKTALAAQSRYEVTEEVQKQVTEADLEKWLRVLPEGRALPQGLRDAIAKDQTCRQRPCVLVMVSRSEALLAGHPYSVDRMVATRFLAQEDGSWMEIPSAGDNWPDNAVDPTKATVEVRTVTRRQLFIDGKPVSSAFE